MRKATVFLVGGAVVLLAAGAVLRFTVAPGLRQLPADLDTTLRFTGTADLLDTAALQSGDLARAFKTAVPVTAEQRLRVTSTRGQTAVVSDETTVTGANNATLSTIKHAWAVDRETLDAAPAPSGATVQRHEGLVVGFPLEPRPRDYPYWDAPTQSRVTAAYQHAERHAGRKTYVYTVHATGPLKDTELVAGLPATLPKAVLLGLAPLLPPAVQQALAASAGQLPEQLPMAYTATADATYWVDTETGYVIDVHQKQAVAASIALGAAVPLASVFALDLQFTPDTVTAVKDDATAAQRGLTLIGTTAPIALAVLAALLVLVAGLLTLRRRNPRPAAPPATEATGRTGQAGAPAAADATGER